MKVRKDDDKGKRKIETNKSRRGMDQVKGEGEDGRQGQSQSKVERMPQVYLAILNHTENTLQTKSFSRYQ